MARYKARHIHLAHETKFRDPKRQFVGKENLVRVFKYLGWLN